MYAARKIEGVFEGHTPQVARKVALPVRVSGHKVEDAQRIVAAGETLKPAVAVGWSDSPDSNARAAALMPQQNQFRGIELRHSLMNVRSRSSVPRDSRRNPRFD